MHQLAEAGTPSPLTPEGEQYPFVLLSHDEQVAVYADSLHDIVGFIIGNGYGDLTEDDVERAFVARQNFAVAMAANLSQVERGLYPALDDLFDQGLEDEDLIGFYMTRPDFGAELASGDILLANETHGPQFSRLFFEGLDDDREWDYAFPFIGIATDYLPYTHIAPPTGNVLLIDPLDELTLINSLLETNEHLAERGLEPVLKFYRLD